MNLEPEWICGLPFYTPSYDQSIENEEGERMLRKILTKGYKEIPLVFINFNYELFKKNGEKDSCMIHIHPLLKNDEIIIAKIEDLIDYIRENYDMSKIP